LKREFLGVPPHLLGPPLRLANDRIGCTAEDVTQDCFLVLYRSPEKYDSVPGGLRPLLIGVARNLMHNRWRKEKRFEPLEEDGIRLNELALG
jgi:DNA-directed RNA polymerase specialized sigma24 family protein